MPDVPQPPRLDDVLDLEAVRALMERLHELTGLSSSLADMEGEVLQRVGWRSICADFHRAHPETRAKCRHCDVELTRDIAEGDGELLRCGNGMVEMATPVVIGGRRLGTLCFGQLFLDEDAPSREHFADQARRLGFDQERYLEAFDEVPRWRRDRAAAAMGFYVALAKTMGSLSDSRVRLAQALADGETLSQELRQSESKSRAIVDNVSVGVALFDHDLKLLEANPRLLGWFPHARLGMHCLEVFRSAPETVCPMKETLADGGLHERELERDTPLGRRLFRMVSSPISAQDGDVVAAISLVEDITERRAAEEQLRQAQRLEAVGNLAGGIAHDFNNILSGILGIAELAQEDMAGEGYPQLDDDLSDIIGAAQRARELVKQILTFARRDVTSMKPQRLTPVVREVASLLRATLPASIELNLDVDEAVPTVLADTTQIHQVLMNLATNACHAMGHQGRLVIGVRAERVTAYQARHHGHLEEGRGYALLWVRDTGRGMDEAVAARIFEPYFTTKERGGTGLGLAVVRGIVRAHQGAIEVDSAPGRGTTFSLYLPLSAELPERAEPAVDASSAGSERVLFVDDEQMITVVAKRGLARLGYRVDTCSDSEEALGVFRSAEPPYDVVVTDLTMPRLSGLELAVMLRDARPTLPLVLCSGYKGMLGDQEAERAGFDAFVHKPLDMKDLGAAIQAAVAKRRA